MFHFLGKLNFNIKWAQLTWNSELVGGKQCNDITVM